MEVEDWERAVLARYTMRQFSLTITYRAFVRGVGSEEELLGPAIMFPYVPPQLRVMLRIEGPYGPSREGKVGVHLAGDNAR